MLDVSYNNVGVFSLGLFVYRPILQKMRALNHTLLHKPLAHPYPSKPIAITGIWTNA